MSRIAKLLLFAILLGPYSVLAQTNSVERLRYNSDTGDYVDRWTIEQGQVQKIVHNYVLLGDDQRTIACVAFVSSETYIWSNGLDVISPSGQSIKTNRNQTIKVAENGTEYRINDNEDQCDDLLALIWSGRSFEGAGTIAAAALLGGGAIVALDNDSEVEEPTPTEPPTTQPPTTEPPESEPPASQTAIVRDDTYRLPLAVTSPRPATRTRTGNISLNDTVPAGTQYFVRRGPTRLGPAGSFTLRTDGSFFYETGSCGTDGVDTFTAAAVFPDGSELVQTVTIIFRGTLNPASPLCTN